MINIQIWHKNGFQQDDDVGAGDCGGGMNGCMVENLVL